MDLALSRKQLLFCVKETTKGDLAYPATTDYVPTAGEIPLGQELEFIKSKEIRDSRGMRDRFTGQKNPGDFSIPMYARLRANDVPVGLPILESAFGSHNAANKKFQTSDSNPSFSIWFKKDHTVFFCKGAVVNNLKLNLVNNDAVTFENSGNFMDMGWVGTDSIASAAVTNDTSVTVKDGSLFCVGGKVQFVEGSNTHNNSGNGYKITAINGNTLTLDDGIEADLAVDDIIEPFLPEVPASSTLGTIIKGKTGVVQIHNGTDYVDVPVVGLEVNLSNGIKFLTDIISANDYPEEYVEGEREVTGTVNLFFLKENLKYFSNALKNVESKIKMKAGDESGRYFIIELQRVSMSTPKLSDDVEVRLGIDFTALETSKNDEIILTYY
jgi:hypothetical protein